MWGFPVFSDPWLQDGKNLPKYSSHAQLSSFVGYSLLHLSTVSIRRNFQTGSVSQQSLGHKELTQDILDPSASLWLDPKHKSKGSNLEQCIRPEFIQEYINTTALKAICTIQSSDRLIH